MCVSPVTSTYIYRVALKFFRLEIGDHHRPKSSHDSLLEEVLLRDFHPLKQMLTGLGKSHFFPIFYLQLSNSVKQHSSCLPVQAQWLQCFSAQSAVTAGKKSFISLMWCVTRNECLRCVSVHLFFPFLYKCMI